MKAKVKFDEKLNKWVVYITAYDGTVYPVGRTTNKKLKLWEMSTWDTKEQAEDWVKSKSTIMQLE